jgi:membrane protease subunit (stomatin/prohibitin family)
MGIFDFLSKQFVDVIDWVDEPGVLAVRFPMQDREIQNGAQLTVRSGQTAMFYNEGVLADAFLPGLHTLETSNLPVLTSLLNWDKGFSAPFKSDVYFFSQKEQTGLKWGTQQPITVRDTEFGPAAHTCVRQLQLPGRGCRGVRGQNDGVARPTDRRRP